MNKEEEQHFFILAMWVHDSNDGKGNLLHIPEKNSIVVKTGEGYPYPIFPNSESINTYKMPELRNKLFFSQKKQ
ncbi:MAG: hypothetical protein KQH63_03700 [Desulfobulbaceae bacterium]|nr:hypothetical protein [Desulfobulbaceae bacterium]